MNVFLNNPRFMVIKFPLLSIVTFVLLLLLAMQVYPGGTDKDPNTVGYIFSENYISDLGRTVTTSGASNLLSFSFFILAFAIMACAFFLYFYGTYSFYKKKYALTGNMYKLGTFFGMCSSLCFIGVALTPANVNLKDHIMFAEWLFRFFFGSSLLYAIVYYKKDKSSNLLSLAHLLIAIGTLVYILLSDFNYNSVLFANEFKAEVISQKLIVGFLLTGITLIGYCNRRNIKQ